MKKIYLSLIACGSLLIAEGQVLQQYHDFSNVKLGQDASQQEALVKKHNPNSARSARNYTVIWEETFDGTDPLETNQGVWTAAGTNLAYWSMSTSATTPLSANVDSDMTGRYLSWYSYGPITNNGTTNESPNFASTPVRGSVESPVIDLSVGDISNGVLLEFETEGMYCCHPEETPFRIAISQDGGASYGPMIEPDFGINRNLWSYNVGEPIVYTLDITSFVSTTPNNVKIMFEWLGDNQFTYASGDFQYNSHYFWSIDNIKFIEKPANEVEVQSFWISDIDMRYEYTEIPLSQASDLIVKAKVQNIGSDIPTNLGIEVTVYDNNMTIIHNSTGGVLQSGNPFNSGSIDSITFNTGFDLSALATGDYFVEAEITYTETDLIEDNNYGERSFRITDNIMSVVDFDRPAFRNPGNFDGDYGEIGTIFMLNNNQNVHGIDFYFSDTYGTNPAATVGKPIGIRIYKFEGGAWSQKVNALVNVEDTPSPIDTWVTFNFHDNLIGGYTPYELEKDSLYLLTIGGWEGNDRFYYVASSVDSDFSCREVVSDGSGGKSFFWNQGDVYLRANFDQTLSVENEVEEFNNLTAYPNPTANSTTIMFTSINNEASSITITDLTGKVVYTDQAAAGVTQYDVNTRNFSEGIYLYTLEMGTYKETKRLVIAK